jgi:hypothetical protein
MKAVNRRLGGNILNERKGRLWEEVGGRNMRHRRAVLSTLAAKGGLLLKIFTDELRGI